MRLDQPGIQLVPASGHAGHRGRLDRQGDEVFRLEVVDVRLPARAGQGLRLERQHPQVVRDLATTELGVEAGRELVVLGRDAGWVAARLPVVVVAGRAAELAVLGLVVGAVVPHRDEGSGADRDGVGAERERLGDVGAAADPARDDQLHLAVQPELLQRLTASGIGRQGSGCRRAR